MSLTLGPVVGMPPGRERTAAGVDLVDAVLAAVAILCLVVHVVLLIVTGTAMLGMVVPMLVLSGLCVAFTCRKGNGHRVREYAVTAGFGIAMLTVHWALMSTSLGHSSHTAAESGAMDHAAMGHGAMDMAGSGSVLSAQSFEGLMQAGLFFAALQIVLAVGASVRALRAGGE
ncbi:hypothetical protein CH298_02135 [Rhodococcoides fascians]|uniref:hypothetical protein n=1 Tax=Rhodococcoides fascians TaxID=1828 RepID=UPI000B9A2E75|nr:hypothetical protein [Rhodococcus fascians]OZE92373.1 hypothetical protein CH303_02135 [Rhodococcus fascians]OZF23006.1 hypothetical protein CH298_02135 [Rhodococcus fascians]OZF72969.1 hypothetical protein CH308_02140 [Rhodococcus fascians]